MQSDQFLPVRIHRSVERRQLDQRLIGLDEVFGPPPATGWVRTVRQALGMSTFDVAKRIGLSGARVKQLEQAEVAGSIRLAQLQRLADALGCEFHYIILPRESLEEMVQRQARLKAAERMASTGALDCPTDDSTLVVEAMSEEFQALVHELIDRRDLWH